MLKRGALCEIRPASFVHWRFLSSSGGTIRKGCFWEEVNCAGFRGAFDGAARLGDCDEVGAAGDATE